MFDLAGWNRRWTERIPSWLVATMVFFFALACFVLPPAMRGALDGLPEGDGPMYDATAMGLARGYGFAEDWSSAEYRLPYKSAGDAPGQSDMAKRTPRVTALRPPGFPALIAASYHLFGRVYWPIRVFNCAAMAATCMIFSQLAYRHAGLLPTIIFAFSFVVFDERTRDYSRKVLTESLGALFTALFVLLLVRLAKNPRLATVCVLGLITGLAILTRSVFLSWFPGLALLVYAVSNPVESWFSRPRLMPPIVYCFVTLLTIAPWMVRNCLVLNAFMPTGTQSGYAMGYAYSDLIIENEGNWGAVPDDFYKDMPPVAILGDIEEEKQKSRYNQAKASQWIRQNWKRIPVLITMKLNRLWRAKNRFQTYLLLCGPLGLALTLHRWEGKIYLVMLLLCSLQVALTYEHFGRFQVPIVAILNVLAATGVWAMLLIATSYRRPFLQVMEVHSAA